MSNFKVFITRKIVSTGINLLERESYKVKVWDEERPLTKSELIDQAKDSDALLSMVSDVIDSEVIDSLPKLKIISNNAVGYDNIDIKHALKKEIIVTNTPDTLTESVSELTVTLLMAYSKNILSFSNWVSEGRWKTWEPTFNLGTELKNKTIGIVGMGKIGQRVARICHGLEMNVIYHSRTKKQKTNAPDDAESISLSELLQRSDFVSVHTDLNPSTRNLFTSSEFLAMKKNAVFINTSRGAIHCQQDLIKALIEKNIAGAILDVTDPEPIEKNSPLLKMANVLITPHIGSATLEARSRMSAMAAQNIIAVEKGTNPKNAINSPV